MPTPRSHLPRKQRKAVYTAHQFARRRYLTVSLSRELRRKYGRRQLPVRKGDTVRVISGSYEGQEERVAKISSRNRSITLDNITTKKGDQKLKPLPIRPNHLLLTRLNLTDPWRRRILRVTEEPAAAAPEPSARAAAPEAVPAPTGTESGPVKGRAPEGSS